MPDIAFHPLFPLDMGPLHYFSVLGRALFTAQHLERNCLGILAHLHMRTAFAPDGSTIMESPDFQKGIQALWEKTLGALVSDLKSDLDLPNKVTSTFWSAVAARNDIAHQVAADVSERLDADLDERIEHILRLVRRIAKADKIASVIIHQLNKDPLPSKNFFDSYEELVVAWVSENTFEE